MGGFTSDEYGPEQKRKKMEGELIDKSQLPPELQDVADEIDRTDPEPVDRTQITTIKGGDPDEVRAKQAQQQTGMHDDYIVLTLEERQKGFVRPLRSSYIHEKCGSSTVMGAALAETYARDPGFYGSTYCCACGAHFPVGEDGEFHWPDGSKVGT